MLGTGPGYAPRNDLSPFGDEIFQIFRVLVVDLEAAVGAEPANLASVVDSFFTGAATPGFVCGCHVFTLPSGFRYQGLRYQGLRYQGLRLSGPLLLVSAFPVLLPEHLPEHLLEHLKEVFL